MNSDPQGLDPADRDAMIRTVMTEAGTPEGWGAVANTIKNRLAAGNFGDSPQAIVTAPKQFEVWANGRAQSVDPRSPQYEAAGRVVDAVAAGAAPDNTNGATHFFSPSGQAALAGDGRQQVPSWAKNQTAAVAGNVFFAPNGRVTYQAKPDAALAFSGDTSLPTKNASASPAKSSDQTPFDLLMSQGGSTAPSEPSSASSGSHSASSASAKAAGALTPFDALMSQGTNTSTPGQTASPANTPAPKVADPNAPAAPSTGATASFVSGALNGLPIVGPAVLGGAQRLSAFERSMDSGTPYAAELAKVQGADSTRASDHPIATAAGRVGGAVLGTVPLIAAAPGLMGAGANAATSTNMFLGGMTNAGIGAADAMARGDNPIAGAAFGYAGGAAGPLAGKVIGAGVNSLVDGASSGANLLSNYIRTGSGSGIPGIGRASANLMNTVINADDPVAVAAFLRQHGPDAMLADAGPSTTGLTSALALKPSDAKSVVQNALTARAAGSNDRISTQLDASLGPAEDPNVVSRNIADLRSQQGQAYNAVHANSPPVDVSPVVAQIDHLLETATGNQRTALQNLRNRELVATPSSIDPETGAITPETYVTNSQTLHNVRKDIDGMINQGQPGLGVEKGAVAGKQGALQSVRGALDDALKTQVPGMADADATSAALAARQAAVERGYNDVLGANGPNPETFAADRAAQPVGVNVAENKGIRGRIDRMFGTGTQRDAVTLNKLLAGGGDGYAAANLGTAFGADNTGSLLDTLARERAFANTTNEVVQNSATARRTAANKLLEQTQPGSLNLLPATAAGMAMQAGKSMIIDPLVRMIMESPNAPRNMEIARMLTAQGATRDQIFAQLQQLNGAQQGASAVGGYLQGLGVTGGNSLLRATGSTNRWVPQSDSVAR